MGSDFQAGIFSRVGIAVVAAWGLLAISIPVWAQAADRAAGGAPVAGAVIESPGAERQAWEAQGLPMADEPLAPIRAELRTSRKAVLAGRPVWVEFTLTNLTGGSLSLEVPGRTHVPRGDLPIALPLSHVFSGTNGVAVTVTNSHGDDVSRVTPPRVTGPIPQVALASQGSLGLRVDLARYYEALTRPGTYTLVWRPYEGQVTSNALEIKIMPERQAVILTEYGKMTMRFYFNEAPNHVANFIELASEQFYDNLAFNRVIPGGLIQGGDPRGDRRGIRPDGKRLKAEFSDISFERGTVGMARSPRDPDSASCQFFICLSRQPSFDGKQTAFGYLVGEESFEVLRRIASVPTDSADRPRSPVYIRAISLENVPLQTWQARQGAAPSGKGRGAASPSPTTQPTVAAEH